MDSNTIILKPGEVWDPWEKKIKMQATTEEVKKAQDKCVHAWREVTLFTSTVTECKKCGKLDERSNT